MTPDTANGYLYPLWTLRVFDVHNTLCIAVESISQNNVKMFRPCVTEYEDVS